MAAYLGMSVARAQEEISPSEFLDWRAYMSMEPRGEGRVDYHFARLISECHHAGARPGERWSSADYMPKFSEVKPKQSVAEIGHRLKMFFEAKMADPRLPKNRSGGTHA